MAQAACCGCFVSQLEGPAATVATGKVSNQGGTRLTRWHLLERDVNIRRELASMIPTLLLPVYITMSSNRLPSVGSFHLLFPALLYHTDNDSFTSSCAGS